MPVWAWILIGIYLLITINIAWDEIELILAYRPHAQKDSYENARDFRQAEIESQRQILIKALKIIGALLGAAAWPLIVIVKVTIHIYFVELNWGGKT
ncbi:MAG: hypothetical protein A2175_02385 [Candidatus Nealsonbacteria bacterium RBG_13_42_11]|uniref:Uncharacterized protein n=1 Tax=Candidatus Nealsonbacteria bacterium RBG_13_42_11 TaxID=1801663 RepID=A0A1G2DZ85_9BACT|nr:MAG: hypothetical protein A2175_02385 [Candidatus Nealsonbacteria bacterium RBG_13_42_11]